MQNMTESQKENKKQKQQYAMCNHSKKSFLLYLDIKKNQRDTFNILRLSKSNSFLSKINYFE